MSGPIRVAISGGGLAGASLMHALLKHNHLDVHIFEAADSFREEGAAVGISRSGLSALDLIGPSAAECLDKAGAVPQHGVRFMLAQGQQGNNMIGEVEEGNDNQRLVKIVHRAPFLRAFLEGVPSDRMHASKKLATVDNADDAPLILHFTDGTTHECDILIGADGIGSPVRKMILGNQDPAAYPRNSGWWAVMSLKSYDQAHSSLGDKLIDAENAREHSWVGDGKYILHNVLEHGRLVQFVICAFEEASVGSEQRYRNVSSEEIKNLYQDWPSNLKKGVSTLLCDQPEQPAMYLWDHAPARTYASGPICIMGDAAHATTPWQGSGCSMSLEDSLILASLLGQVKTKSQAIVALDVYDRLRRPRTQRIVESSRKTGMIMTGRDEETGLDLDKLRTNLLPRWNFIIEFDNKKHREEAIEMLNRELAEK